ncbi:hypothetical protein CLCR_11045 [Cladophialophora carrionii]|uniref:Uncharacterized protein n=1 Tax=Cladophialophora carrionii TaxID=86049 RepID=A0A1C1CY72_9EURO|nr:hypothetical protein CLCR_11045 [Cladophialophora carrionii]
MNHVEELQDVTQEKANANRSREVSQDDASPRHCLCSNRQNNRIGHAVIWPAGINEAVRVRGLRYSNCIVAPNEDDGIELEGKESRRAQGQNFDEIHAVHNLAKSGMPE